MPWVYGSYWRHGPARRRMNIDKRFLLSTTAHVLVDCPIGPCPDDRPHGQQDQQSAKAVTHVSISKRLVAT
jgi:hypothetical protein